MTRIIVFWGLYEGVPTWATTTYVACRLWLRYEFCIIEPIVTDFGTMHKYRGFRNKRSDCV